jgi:hypothetical protein
VTDTEALRLAAWWMRERSDGEDHVADLLDLAADYPTVQDPISTAFARAYLGETL